MRKSVLAGAVCLLSYAAAAAADEADGDAVPQSLGVIEVIGSADKTLPPGADVLDIDTIKLQDRRNVA